MFVFIRFFFIFFVCIYNFNHLLVHNSKKSINPTVALCISLGFSLLTACSKQSFPFLYSFIPFLFLLIMHIFSNLNQKLTFIVGCISLALSYSTFAFCSGIVALVIGLLTLYTDYYSLEIGILVSGLLQLVLSVFIFNLKRLHNGMPFLHSTTFLNLGTILGVVFIILYSCTYFYTQPESLKGVPITIIITFGLFILLHWWQSQLTKAYRKRLAQLELESLRTELEQKTALLKKLETQNKEMGRLIHKDNKLIPAMEHAVSTYLASDFTDIALNQAQGQALLSDLKEFSEARRGILATFTPVSAPKYNTGIPSLDAILVYMYQKAQAQGIRLYATATPESIAALPPALTTEKLVHMLSDLLENAIIATKASTEKQIQVQIYLANGLFTIEVADTGCSFEPATLISFGLEKASTHLTEGGSGIGLLDIWKIKEETKASIHIHEYESGAPFSKKLFITFDKKNKYVIHTWRDKELSPLVNRGDIVILPQEQV